MVIYMKETLKMIKGMEMVCITLKMEIDMKESTLMIKETDTGKSIFIIITSMREK